MLILQLFLELPKNFVKLSSSTHLSRKFTKPFLFYRHPSPVVPGIYFCSFPCYLQAIKSYHLHEKNILKDYIIRCKYDETTERSGCIFLALKAVAKKPWTWYCDNKRSELFMRTDPAYGVTEDLQKLDTDEMKLIHLFNLVHHEDQVDYK